MIGPRKAPTPWCRGGSSIARWVGRSSGLSTTSCPAGWPRYGASRARTTHPEGPTLPHSPGRVAQWESARFTRERSLVRNQPRPSFRLTTPRCSVVRADALPSEPTYGAWRDPMTIHRPPSRAADTAATTVTNLGELLLRAVRRYDGPAIRYRRDGAWVDISYPELGTIAGEIARGLIALGIESGQRVAILSNTRPEWTLTD